RLSRRFRRGGGAQPAAPPGAGGAVVASQAHVIRSAALLRRAKWRDRDAFEIGRRASRSGAGLRLDAAPPLREPPGRLASVGMTTAEDHPYAFSAGRGEI